ncbi:MAG: hypothetical protein EOP35_24450, partial [Rubrivivax sp.]
MQKHFIAALRGFIRVVLALVILFEEWGWEPLRRAFARQALQRLLDLSDDRQFRQPREGSP